MKLFPSLTYGGLMSRSLKIKSKSPEFHDFIMKMDDVLCKTQHLTADGKQVDADDDHFKDQRTRLAKTRLEFEWSHPVYPINEFVASDLVYSEIKAIEEEHDIAASVENNNV